MMIVGITGRKGSGKSTVAKHLVERHGLVRIAFADPLKTMLKAIGLTDEQLYGGDKETPSDILCGTTPRHAMQTLGTEWGRALIGENLWVNAWTAVASRMFDYSSVSVVADDVRFPNEVAAICKLGGRVVRVERSASNVALDMHESESWVDALSCERTLFNDGSLRDLCDNVDRMLKEWST